MELITHEARPQSVIAAVPFQSWLLPNGVNWAEFYRRDDDYLIRFPRYADYLVSANGRSVNIWPTPTVATATLNHLYLNQVLPLALSRQFKLILHGSAVLIGSDAVAFLGESGAGKSTLAVSFALAGNPILTDDGLELARQGNDYLVQPSHPSVRLWEDSELELIPRSVTRSDPVQFTEKMRLLADDKIRFAQEAAPLKKIYLLADDEVDEVEITRADGHVSMIELVKNSFLLDVDARDMLQHHFSEIAQIIKKIPVYSLAYPCDYSALADVRAELLRHVG